MLLSEKLPVIDIYAWVGVAVLRRRFALSERRYERGKTMTKNVHAQHGDSRVEELRQKYGDMAGMKVEDLRMQAKEAGIDRPSEKRKEELLQALNGQRGGGKRR
jgi:hypothetical protein